MSRNRLVALGALPEGDDPPGFILAAVIAISGVFLLCLLIACHPPISNTICANGAFGGLLTFLTTSSSKRPFRRSLRLAVINILGGALIGQNAAAMIQFQEKSVVSFFVGAIWFEAFGVIRHKITLVVRH